MLNEFAPLTPLAMKPGTTVQQPLEWPPEKVRLNNPALYVMTDFQRSRPYVIERHKSVDDASQRMIANRVRMLLVLDVKRAVVGLVTATDILSERVVAATAAAGGDPSKVTMGDVMTPLAKLDYLRLEDVRRANVGQVIATLKKCHRLHAVVVEEMEGDDAATNFGVHMAAGPQQMVRGVFSTSQIARQLGADIRTTDIDRTYAELEAFLDARG